MESELKAWTRYQIDESLAEALVANNFKAPTPVQEASLQYLTHHIDMVIAAKTGQGKTLCFGLPILQLLIKRVEKRREKDPDVEQALDTASALILSPTRELAMQIRDMIQAVIPSDYENDIKTCCLVGGMSIQK